MMSRCFGMHLVADLIFRLGEEISNRIKHISLQIFPAIILDNRIGPNNAGLVCVIRLGCRHGKLQYTSR